MEKALSRVANEAIEVVCAGRTDTGVHALGQVVHFETAVDRDYRGWLLGANSNLPDDIAVTWARPMNDTFHARFSATARHYQYRILNRLQRSALMRHRAWWLYAPLDAQRMHDAAQLLVGEHDFSSFRAAGCRAATPNRNVSAIRIERRGDFITIDVSANAFLQHMVRNLTGSLVAIGNGSEDIGWLRDVLESRDRRQGGIAAPPHGLTLMSVDYPDEFDIPLPLSID